MTHGCLKIVSEAFPEGIVLHTSHTGMDIPLAVVRAPTVVAEVHDYLKSRDDARKAFGWNGRLRDWLEDAPSVASLVIAAYPLLLVPLYPQSIADLPKWSGYDDPYVLTLVSCKEWTLKHEGEEGEVEKIDPSEIFVSQFEE